ncbi:unnamed protein product [Anisakis simplex]|uniref:Uncharacterized protein n=1 Tax=Anisakis simplex TaxID=6269 RepID=A0A0M3JNL8_ANISI|nr:unnamed protein product [Anisakis simplex]
MSSVERYRSNTYHSHACHPHLSRFDELRRNVASDTDPSPSCRQANPPNRCVHLSANSTPRDIRIQVPLKNLLKTNSRSQTSVQSSPYTFNINKSTGDAEIHEESDQKRFV